MEELRRRSLFSSTSGRPRPHYARIRRLPSAAQVLRPAHQVPMRATSCCAAVLSQHTHEPRFAPSMDPDEVRAPLLRPVPRPPELAQVPGSASAAMALPREVLVFVCIDQSKPRPLWHALTEPHRQQPDVSPASWAAPHALPSAQAAPWADLNLAARQRSTGLPPLHQRAVAHMSSDNVSECEDSFVYALFDYFMDSIFFKAGYQVQVQVKRCFDVRAMLVLFWSSPSSSSTIIGWVPGWQPGTSRVDVVLLFV